MYIVYQLCVLTKKLVEIYSNLVLKIHSAASKRWKNSEKSQIYYDLQMVVQLSQRLKPMYFNIFFPLLRSSEKRCQKMLILNFAAKQCYVPGSVLL